MKQLMILGFLLLNYLSVKVRKEYYYEYKWRVIKLYF